jgi:hypothetical protein
MWSVWFQLDVPVSWSTQETYVFVDASSGHPWEIDFNAMAGDDGKQELDLGPDDDILETDAEVKIAAVGGAIGAAAYDAETNTILLSSRATQYILFRMMSHSRHCVAIGKEEYINLTPFERHDYVLSRVLQNSDQFSPAEIQYAKDIVESYR